MILTRRKLLGLVAAGAVIAPALLAVQRTIFLPPRGGWPRVPIASYPVNGLAIDGYTEALASGDFTYDHESGIMHLWRHDPERAQIDGKFHSATTGQAYDWDDFSSEGSAQYVFTEPLGADGRSKRAMIDDGAWPMMDETRMQAWWDGLPAEERQEYSDFMDREVEHRAKFGQRACSDEPNFSIPDENSRARAAKRAAEIRSRLV